MWVPLGRSGMARSWMTPSLPSTSASRGAHPLASFTIASSTAPRAGASSVVVWPR